jgi:hypothetical protein
MAIQAQADWRASYDHPSSHPAQKIASILEAALLESAEMAVEVKCVG